MVVVGGHETAVAQDAEQNQLFAVLGRLGVVLEPAMEYIVGERVASAEASVFDEAFVDAVRVARPAH